jgi:serine/threonine-protein kinase HipA
MPRPKRHIPLNVLLNGRLVGHLNKSSAGAIDFQYDTGWLAWEHAMPVSLSLPLREDRYIGQPVIAVFENLLPDNDAIRRRLAASMQAEDSDAYSLLAVIGRDCVGALQFVREGVDAGPVGEVRGEEVTDEQIAETLKQLGTVPLGVTAESEFRISIAGAQEKTALLREGDRWCKPLGATATTHILKPEIGKTRSGLDLTLSVENEHLCMKFASALGLPVAKTTIEHFAGQRVLVVERFDRSWIGGGRLLRLPQEDCCQALSVPPDTKYQADGGPGMHEIINLLKGSDDPEADQKVFLKAQICFWLLAATDGHAKNFSVFLHPGGRFRLTPLYDIMSAQPNLDANEIRKNKLKLAMSVGDQRHYVIDTILPRHFVQTANRSGVSTEVVTALFEELLEDVPKALEKVRTELPSGFPEKLVESISHAVVSRLDHLKYYLPAARESLSAENTLKTS